MSSSLTTSTASAISRLNRIVPAQSPSRRPSRQCSIQASDSGTIAGRRASSASGSPSGLAWKKPPIRYGPAAHGQRVESGPLATGRIAARIPGADGHEIGSLDHEPVDELRLAVGEIADLGVDELHLVVGVQKVGQAVGGQADPAEHAEVEGERVEPDQRSVGDRIRFMRDDRRPLEDDGARRGRCDGPGREPRRIWPDHAAEPTFRRHTGTPLVRTATNGYGLVPIDAVRGGTVPSATRASAPPRTRGTSTRDGHTMDERQAQAKMLRDTRSILRIAARLEFLRRAEDDARRRLRRPSTASELDLLLRRYPGD